MNVSMVKTFGLKLVQKGLKYFRDNAPTIFTAVGCAGVVSTAIFASKATIKAKEIVDDYQAQECREITTLEKVDKTWKCYIPTAAMGALSISSIVMSNRVSAKRAAILAAAVNVAEDRISEYQDKIMEIAGKGKATKIEDAISEDLLASEDFSSGTVLNTGRGTTLCIDGKSRQRFLSDMESIRRAVNDFNEMILKSFNGASLNDFYYLLGIDGIPDGDSLGWSLSSTGQLDVYFTSAIKDGQPVLVLRFRNDPIPNFTSAYNHG